MVQNINKQVKVHIEALCFFSAAKWFVCFSVTVTFTPYLLAPPFPLSPLPLCFYLPITMVSSLLWLHIVSGLSSISCIFIG